MQVLPGTGTYIDGLWANCAYKGPVALAVYAAHSSSCPNARLELWTFPRTTLSDLVRHRLWLVASEPIPAGAEIRYDASVYGAAVDSAAVDSAAVDSAAIQSTTLPTASSRDEDRSQSRQGSEGRSQSRQGSEGRSQSRQGSEDGVADLCTPVVRETSPTGAPQARAPEQWRSVRVPYPPPTPTEPTIDRLSELRAVAKLGSVEEQEELIRSEITSELAKYGEPSTGGVLAWDDPLDGGDARLRTLVPTLFTPEGSFVGSSKSPPGRLMINSPTAPLRSRLPSTLTLTLIPTQASRRDGRLWRHIFLDALAESAANVGCSCRRKHRRRRRQRWAPLPWWTQMPNIKLRHHYHKCALIDPS